MASHPSRDELRSELRRQQLPQAYIARLLAELDDHYEDLGREYLYGRGTEAAT